MLFVGQNDQSIAMGWVCNSERLLFPGCPRLKGHAQHSTDASTRGAVKIEKETKRPKTRPNDSKMLISRSSLCTVFSIITARVVSSFSIAQKNFYPYPPPLVKKMPIWTRENVPQTIRASISCPFSSQRTCKAFSRSQSVMTIIGAFTHC